MDGRGHIQEQLTDLIREEILKEALRPGSKLTEQQLSMRFEVSRTPVREAIGKLESEGLVETIPNRGAFVVGLSAMDAFDMFEIRKHYEVIAARRAAMHTEKEVIEKLDEIVAFMRHYTKRGDLRRMKQINKDYHEALYRAADSRLLLVSIRRINTYLKLSIHTKDYRREHLPAILAEHEQVYMAIKGGDPDKAAAAMGAHIETTSLRALKRAGM
jgi:DNA-binding GntR family transcriptional regulator